MVVTVEGKNLNIYLNFGNKQRKRRETDLKRYVET